MGYRNAMSKSLLHLFLRSGMLLPLANPRIASIGECMIELREQPDGTLRRSHGGRHTQHGGLPRSPRLVVDYVTALGDDVWSEEMVTRWREEGIGVGLVQRLPNRLPGLYIIQTDPNGERRFLYWRDSAAARRLFDHLSPRRAGAVRCALPVRRHAFDL